MKLRSPAELYIKYLAVHPDNHTNESIIGILQEVDLDYVDKNYIQKIRERSPRPLPFRPTDRTHQRSQRFLFREGLHGLFFPSSDLRMAMDILENPRAKEFVESMILSHAPPAAIANMVTSQYRVLSNSRAVENYKKYFWNIDLLDATQMRALLNYRQEMCGSDGELATAEERAQYRAARNSGYLDPRRLAADLPYSPVSALMVQMRMGMMPQTVNLAKLLDLTQRAAIHKALEATTYGGVKDSIRALNFTLVAKHMEELLESAVKPDEHLREDLQRIALGTDKNVIPSIHQLSGGRHTVDMLPTEVSHDATPPDAEAEPGRSPEADGGSGKAPGGDAGVPGG